MAAGGHGLGCSMMELDPGKTAWPFHYHHANEEAIYVLHGEATLRLGTERMPLRAGDYVAFPTGADHAHQLTNTGVEVVRYLVISTMVVPDVCVYPDARKVGVVGALLDDEGQTRRVVTYPLEAEVGYWAREITKRDPGRTTEPSTPRQDHRPDDRKAKLDEIVESELEALKRKLQQESSVAHEDLDALERKLDG